MSLPAGTRLGRYEIVGPIGAGGMGEVYRARDAQLDRDVAIKVLPGSVAQDPERLARFHREAKAVAALSHPNILSIFDFGTENGVSFAVMELLTGATLRERLDAGQIPQSQAVGLALQIARGLSAAHDKGIVHRDLKPENILVLKSGHLKVLDFGLAKRVETTAPDAETSAPGGSAHTEPGTVMGTVGYMSPEQVRGLAVDHRTDIFSFGIVLHELLSGSRAFKRDTVAETLTAILREEPPSLLEAGRHVSPAVDRIVRHCLEKDRENRFHSAHDIAFALSEQASTEPVAVVAGASRFTATRSLVLVAGVVALIAFAGGMLALRQRSSVSSAVAVARVAVLPFENLGAPEDDYFADGIADAVRGKLTTLPGLEVIARASSTPYKKSTKTPQQIAGELHARYLLTATVRWQRHGGTNRVQVSPELVEVRESVAPASRWQQPFDAALTDVFQVQSDIASRVAQALGVALGTGEAARLSETPTQNLAAYDAFLKGEQVSDSLAGPAFTLRNALTFYEQAVALDPAFAQAWARISQANALRYSMVGASPELAEHSRLAAERAASLAADRPETYLARGTYERLVTGDYRRALEEFDKGRRLAPANADLLTGIARAEVRLGRWDAAVDHLHLAERLDPRSLAAPQALVLALMYLRRFDEMRETANRGLAIAPSNIRMFYFKVLSFLGQGDLAGARGLVKTVPAHDEPAAVVAYLATYQDLVWVLDDERRAMLMRLSPSAFDDNTSIWGLCLAQAASLAGDAASVRAHADLAARDSARQLLATPDDAQILIEHAVALAFLGRKADAIAEGRRAVGLVPVAKDVTIGPYLQHQLVRIYLLSGDREKALDQLEPLLRLPYYLTPAWLTIDPTFDLLRGHPRFQSLVTARNDSVPSPVVATR